MELHSPRGRCPVRARAPRPCSRSSRRPPRRVTARCCGQRHRSRRLPPGSQRPPWWTSPRPPRAKANSSLNIIFPQEVSVRNGVPVATRGKFLPTKRPPRLLSGDLEPKLAGVAPKTDTRRTDCPASTPCSPTVCMAPRRRAIVGEESEKLSQLQYCHSYQVCIRDPAPSPGSC